MSVGADVGVYARAYAGVSAGAYVRVGTGEIAHKIVNS